MSVQFKIIGGTPKSDKPLCLTCKRAKIVKGQRLEQVILCPIFANAIPSQYNSRGSEVPFRVSECSEYHPVNRPWLHEMEEMAWIIEARKRGPTGFDQGNRTVDTSSEDIMEVIVTKPDKNRDSYDQTPQKGYSKS